MTIVIHTKHNIQNICAAFIISQDNIEYFDQKNVKFVIFDYKSDINNNNQGYSNVKNKYTKLYSLANLFKQLKYVGNKTRSFDTLKLTSKYSIEFVDFITLLQNSNIDPSSISDSNDKLLEQLTNFLINKTSFHDPITFEYASQSYIYGDNATYILDCSDLHSITSVTRYVHLHMFDNILNSVNNKTFKHINRIYHIQDINIYLFIIVHILFILMFIIYIRKIYYLYEKVK